MVQPLMPKATAVWLVDYTALTFAQIADFCGLHPLEVKGIADGDVAQGIVGTDPVATGQVTQDEIGRCAADPSARLVLSEPTTPIARRKGPRYTPVSRRQDRPDAIAWLVRYHPELTDGQISKLVGTTKPTINAVRERSHWNSPNIKPVDPVALGLCTQIDLDDVVVKAAAKERRAEEREAKKKRPKTKAAVVAAAPEPGPEPETQAVSGSTLEPAAAPGSTLEPAAAPEPEPEPETQAVSGSTLEPAAAPGSTLEPAAEPQVEPMSEPNPDSAAEPEPETPA